MSGAGELRTTTNETDDARWFTVDEVRTLPDLMGMYLETIEDCLASSRGWWWDLLLSEGV